MLWNLYYGVIGVPLNTQCFMFYVSFFHVLSINYACKAKSITFSTSLTLPTKNRRIAKWLNEGKIFTENRISCGKYANIFAMFKKIKTKLIHKKKLKQSRTTEESV